MFHPNKMLTKNADKKRYLGHKIDKGVEHGGEYGTRAAGSSCENFLTKKKRAKKTRWSVKHYSAPELSRKLNLKR